MWQLLLCLVLLLHMLIGYLLQQVMRSTLQNSWLLCSLLSYENNSQKPYVAGNE